MKIAIVTDSNSGITQKQAQELGVFVLAMPFQIDGETYYEDITLTQEEFYKKLREGGNISTSQPSPGSVTDLWDKILQEYDQIVHIPMSSGLSGSCQTAIMLAQEEEYDGKVYVVNNQRISVTQRQSVIDAKSMAEAGYDAAAIQKRLEANRLSYSPTPVRGRPYSLANRWAFARMLVNGRHPDNRRPETAVTRDGRHRRAAPVRKRNDPTPRWRRWPCTDTSSSRRRSARRRPIH